MTRIILLSTQKFEKPQLQNAKPEFRGQCNITSEEVFKLISYARYFMIFKKI